MQHMSQYDGLLLNRSQKCPRSLRSETNAEISMATAEMSIEMMQSKIPVCKRYVNESRNSASKDSRATKNCGKNVALSKPQNSLGRTFLNGSRSRLPAATWKSKTSQIADFNMMAEQNKTQVCDNRLGKHFSAEITRHKTTLTSIPITQTDAAGSESEAHSYLLPLPSSIRSQHLEWEQETANNQNTLSKGLLSDGNWMSAMADDFQITNNNNTPKSSTQDAGVISDSTPSNVSVLGTCDKLALPVGDVDRLFTRLNMNSHLKPSDAKTSNERQQSHQLPIEKQQNIYSKTLQHDVSMTNQEDSNKDILLKHSDILMDHRSTTIEDDGHSSLTELAFPANTISAVSISEKQKWLLHIQWREIVAGYASLEVRKRSDPACNEKTICDLLEALRVKTERLGRLSEDSDHCFKSNNSDTMHQADIVDNRQVSSSVNKSKVRKTFVGGSTSAAALITDIRKTNVVLKHNQVKPSTAHLGGSRSASQVRFSSRTQHGFTRNKKGQFVRINPTRKRTKCRTHGVPQTTSTKSSSSFQGEKEITHVPEIVAHTADTNSDTSAAASVPKENFVVGTQAEFSQTNLSKETKAEERYSDAAEQLQRLRRSMKILESKVGFKSPSKINEKRETIESDMQIKRQQITMTTSPSSSLISTLPSRIPQSEYDVMKLRTRFTSLTTTDPAKDELAKLPEVSTSVKQSSLAAGFCKQHLKTISELDLENSNGNSRRIPVDATALRKRTSTRLREPLSDKISTKLLLTKPRNSSDYGSAQSILSASESHNIGHNRIDERINLGGLKLNDQKVYHNCRQHSNVAPRIHHHHHHHQQADIRSYQFSANNEKSASRYSPERGWGSGMLVTVSNDSIRAPVEIGDRNSPSVTNASHRDEKVMEKAISVDLKLLQKLNCQSTTMFHLERGEILDDDDNLADHDPVSYQLGLAAERRSDSVQMNLAAQHHLPSSLLAQSESNETSSDESEVFKIPLMNSSERRRAPAYPDNKPKMVYRECDISSNDSSDSDGYGRVEQLPVSTDSDIEELRLRILSRLNSRCESLSLSPRPPHHTQRVRYIAPLRLHGTPTKQLRYSTRQV